MKAPPPGAGPSGRRRGWLAAGAGLFWTLFCLRWFDVAAPVRPAWLAAVPAALLLTATLALALAAAWPEGGAAQGSTLGAGASVLLVMLLAAGFRLPLAVQGAAGYLTPDGALSGIVALHLRDGIERLVFVPHVPYSGSLKSHVTAALAVVLDPARAFALVSLAFYAAFVAGLAHLAALRAAALALPAGLYAAFAPAFVTRYSLSNDGNYIEVLAAGTWAFVLVMRAASAGPAGRRGWMLAGVLLGLAFWCHLLAVIYAVALGLWLVLRRPPGAVAGGATLAAGFILGALPALLWNAAHGWASLRYLLPGGTRVGDLEEGPRLLDRLWTIAADQMPVLLGRDFGYGAAIDGALWAMALLACGGALWALARAARTWWRERESVLGALLLLTAVNLAVALLALPALPGNPRYLLFLMTALPVFLAEAFAFGRGRLLLGLMVGLGALGSLAQAPGALRADGQWRAFAAGLEAERVGFCYTDFFLATKLNFLSEERVVCSAKLGPTTTEYFFDYRRRVEAAPAAALIAVNTSHADKLERRLDRLGVSYERRDLMKPVLLRLSRKVDPEELFPDRTFPWR